MPTDTLKGNNTGSTANPTDLTASQVLTMIGAANTALSNLASTAVNVSISPGVTGTINLGDANHSWANATIIQLRDNAGTLSIDTYARRLYDVSGLTSVDWTNRTLINAAGSGLMTWGTSLQLGDTVGFVQLIIQPGAVQVRNELQFFGATSMNNVSILANTSTATYSLTLPIAQGTANQVLAQSGIAGILTWTSPSSFSIATSQLTGTLAAGQFPALTGDVTTTAGSFATSLVATTNATLTTLSALTTASSLASIGTVTTGTWNATTIAVAHGGTGDTSFTAYAPIAGGTTTTGVLQSLSTGMSNVGYILTSTGSSSVPTWQAAGTPAFSGLTTGGAIYASSATTVASIAAGTNGQVLQSNGTSAPVWSNPIDGYNFLVNGAFDYWQAGTSTTATSTGGASPTAVHAYQADQWYVNNQLGGGTTEGIVTYSQVAGTLNGSIFGASFKITTAPSGTGTGINPLQAYQTLSNKASIALYNQTASFSINVKALGNVNSISLGIVYQTSEIKGGTVITGLTNFTVNSSTFTNCALNGISLSTHAGTSGVIGVVVQINGVSSGNTYDLNNGFVLEQGMLNEGSVAAPFQRQSSNPAQELAACQYFYEVLNTSAATSKPIAIGFVSSASTTGYFTYPYKVNKRTAASASVDSVSHFNALNAVANAAITGFSDLGGDTDTAYFSVTLNGTYASNSGLGLQTNNTAARMYFDSRI